jgi:hypothetical protein
MPLSAARRLPRRRAEGINKNGMEVAGFEPATRRLEITCSPAELHPQFGEPETAATATGFFLEQSCQFII